jgi:tetratricopeptide (TPR) repeat protein
VVVAGTQPLSIVTALSLAAVMALASPAGDLPSLAGRGRLLIATLTLPAIAGALALVVGEIELKMANHSADPAAYAIAHRLLPPWPEVSAVGVKAYVLESRATALASAREATRRSPLDEIGWVRLGALESNFGSSEDAVKAFERALQLNPSQVEAKNSLDAIAGRPASSP